MLIVCPTPIGNLGDVTARQREALEQADVIACEDTRRTGKLLELLGISRVDKRPKLVSYHEHNEAKRLGVLLDALAAGKQVVLVSDAGTPTISDPGYLLVRQAAAAGHAIAALPGATAGVVALSASGLPTDRFLFEGFVPARNTARRQRLEQLKAFETTVVLYESPYRVVELLEDVKEIFGHAHEVCVGRELTKMHEEYLRGAASQVHAELAAREVQGEFVVVLAPFVRELSEEEIEAAIDDKIAELLEQGMRPRGIKEVVAELFEVRKSQLYDRIERVKKGKEG
jgi:16S rRNA (cytidine1402-2'-O)-methyltransferase